MTQTERVLAAVRDGCETVGDVEAELDFTVTRHIIAAHLHDLKRRGCIIRVGDVLVETERTIRGRFARGAVKAGRYRAADHSQAGEARAHE